MKLNEDSRDQSINIFTDIFHQSIKRINPYLSYLEASQCVDGLSLAPSSE
ncbi:MAG: hypothetical protein KUG76_04705 [Gammaproteobacteria bacterium]|nr:hypothetical protein [Gammaproteobacteria bacterium]